MIEKLEWKVDRIKLVMALWWGAVTHFIFPALCFLLMTDALQIPMDGNTYFGIFATIFFIRVGRLLINPPRYAIPEETTQ